MQFKGTVEIAAPRDTVWAFLMDPNQVGSCGPGVESIDVVDEDHFKAKAKVGIGFISAKFNVDMTVAEKNAPDLAVLKAHGQAPGSAVDATANMALSGPGGGADDDGLVGRRADRGNARLGRGAADRGDGQQDDRPDLRLHPVEARGRLSDGSRSGASRSATGGPRSGTAARRAVRRHAPTVRWHEHVPIPGSRERGWCPKPAIGPSSRAWRPTSWHMAVPHAPPAWRPFRAE